MANATVVLTPEQVMAADLKRLQAQCANRRVKVGGGR